MTGATFRIEIDDKLVRDALAGLKRRALDMSPAMDDIGGMLVTSVIHRFETGSGPGGKPWKPWSAAYAKRRRRTDGGTKILRLEGHLQDSTTHRFGRDFVEVGVNRLYGAIHQFGGRAGRNLAAQIPARPFLGVDAGDKAAIVNILAGHVRGLT